MTINESVSSRVRVPPLRVISFPSATGSCSERRRARSFTNRFSLELLPFRIDARPSNCSFMRSFGLRTTYSFIHSFNSFLFLSHWGNSMITARLSSSSYTYTHTPLIEISSNAARTHLTDAHQMHVIHPTGERDYTSHSLLSLLVDLPSCFRVTRTCPLHVSEMTISDCCHVEDERSAFLSLALSGAIAPRFCSSVK